MQNKFQKHILEKMQGISSDEAQADYLNQDDRNTHQLNALHRQKLAMMESGTATSSDASTQATRNQIAINSLIATAAKAHESQDTNGFAKTKQNRQRQTAQVSAANENGNDPTSFTQAAKTNQNRQRQTAQVSAANENGNDPTSFTQAANNLEGLDVIRMRNNVTSNQPAVTGLSKKTNDPLSGYSLLGQVAPSAIEPKRSEFSMDKENVVSDLENKRQYISLNGAYKIDELSAKKYASQYDESSHIAYICGLCSELEKYDVSVHPSLQNLSVQDYLVLTHQAISLGVPKTIDVESDVVINDCILKLNELKNDGIHTKLKLDGGHIQSGGADLSVDDFIVCNNTREFYVNGVRRPMNYIEKFIWIHLKFNTIDESRLSDEERAVRKDVRRNLYIRAIIFDSDFTYNNETKEIILTPAANKKVKISYKQPKYGKIRSYDMADSIPDAIVAHGLAQASSPRSVLSTDLKHITLTSKAMAVLPGVKAYEAVELDELRFGEIELAKYMWISNNTHDENKSGKTEADAVYFKSLYPTPAGQCLLIMAGILRMFSRFKSGIAAVPEQRVYTLQISNIFSAVFNGNEMPFNHAQIEKVNQTTRGAAQEPNDLIRMDLVYLLLDYTGGKYNINFSMNPLLGEINTNIQNIMNIILVATRHEGITKRVKPAASRKLFTEDNGNTLHDTDVHTEITTFKQYEFGADHKVKCKIPEAQELTMPNKMLDILNTNKQRWVNHNYCAIMSHLVYSSSDIVKSFFNNNPTLKYLDGFDPDPDWTSRNGTIHKHRVHVWYELQSELPEFNTYNMYIVFRGSHTTRDWVEPDLNILYGTAHWYEERVVNMPKLIRSIQEKFCDKIKDHIDKKYVVNMNSSGHSLGGFLGLMLSYNSLMNCFATLKQKRGHIIRFESYIFPVVFNPYCSEHHNTKEALGYLPDGVAYRVKGATTAVANYNAGDVASKMLSDTDKFNFDIHQVWHMNYRRVPPNSDGDRFGKIAMTNAHIMFQFIGSLWIYIQSLSCHGDIKCWDFEYVWVEDEEDENGNIYTGYRNDYTQFDLAEIKRRNVAYLGAPAGGGNETNVENDHEYLDKEQLNDDNEYFNFEKPSLYKMQYNKFEFTKEMVNLLKLQNGETYQIPVLNTQNIILYSELYLLVIDKTGKIYTKLIIPSTQTKKPELTKEYSGGSQRKSTRAKKRYNAKTRRGRRNQRR